MSNIDTIIETRERLNARLRNALSTMERKDTIMQIREEILRNQCNCPHHDSKYNWAVIDGVCPYCGYHLSNKDRED